MKHYNIPKPVVYAVGVVTVKTETIPGTARTRLVATSSAPRDIANLPEIARDKWSFIVATQTVHYEPVFNQPGSEFKRVYLSQLMADNILRLQALRIAIEQGDTLKAEGITSYEYELVQMGWRPQLVATQMPSEPDVYDIAVQHVVSDAQAAKANNYATETYTLEQLQEKLMQIEGSVTEANPVAAPAVESPQPGQTQQAGVYSVDERLGVLEQAQVQTNQALQTILMKLEALTPNGNGKAVHATSASPEAPVFYGGGSAHGAEL